jgi:hypothetical protein
MNFLEWPNLVLLLARSTIRCCVQKLEASAECPEIYHILSSSFAIQVFLQGMEFPAGDVD